MSHLHLDYFELTTIVCFQYQKKKDFDMAYITEIMIKIHPQVDLQEQAIQAEHKLSYLNSLEEM